MKLRRVAGLALPVVAAWAVGAATADRPPVAVGLERLEAEGVGSLRGKRVGMVVHAASVTSSGRHAVDVLRRGGVAVQRLFAPEHGLRSDIPTGAPVPEGFDVGTGLPVMSLYGRRTKPAPEELRDLDALVFDLQDAGVRFDSYEDTLLLSIEAAADAGIELVVLDRPNPLGGERVEGPESESRGTPPASLEGLAPGPLVHGLTVGEMAGYVNSRRDRRARLTVVSMTGWKRWMTWKDTRRPWVAPSPGWRTWESALAYPATALIESTNVSAGQGAEPFLLLGAPWLRVRDLLSAAAWPLGFRLTPASFRPEAEPAAPAPPYRGEDCAGVRVRVIDPPLARPYALGLTLLRALRGQPEFRWRQPDALDRLLGTRRVREALEHGDAVEAILKADAPGIERFRKERRSALLY